MLTTAPMQTSYLQELPLPVLEIIAAKLDVDLPALAALRATCTWCSQAAGTRARRLLLPYHTKCERMSKEQLQRTRTEFPSITDLHLDCSGVSPHQEHPLLRGNGREEPQIAPQDADRLASTLQLWPTLRALHVSAGPHDLLLPPLLGMLSAGAGTIAPSCSVSSWSSSCSYLTSDEDEVVSRPDSACSTSSGVAVDLGRVIGYRSSSGVGAAPASQEQGQWQWQRQELALERLGLHNVHTLPAIPDLKAGLAGCRTLRELELDFEGGLPHRYLAALAAAPALEVLRVRLMQVTDVTLDYVTTVAGLTSLELHAKEGLCLTVGGLNQLAALPVLHALTLRVDGHASLNNPRLARMETLPGLERAEVDMKLLDGTWLSWLGRAAPGATHVRVASPYGTYFTSAAAWQALAQLPRAKVQVDFGDARHCRLLECNLEKLSGVTNLESLHVCGATWGPFAFDHLLPLRRLQSLHLTGVSFVGRGYGGFLHKLASLPRLADLTLHGTALEEPWAAGQAEARELAAAAPGLRRVDLKVSNADAYAAEVAVAAAAGGSCKGGDARAQQRSGTGASSSGSSSGVGAMDGSGACGGWQANATPPTTTSSSSSRLGSASGMGSEGLWASMGSRGSSCRSSADLSVVAEAVYAPSSLYYA